MSNGYRISEDAFFQVQAVARQLVESDKDININAALVTAALLQVNATLDSATDGIHSIEFEIERHFNN